MSYTNETGHAVNVGHFHELISQCEGYGEKYNPSNKNLLLPALNTKYTEAGNVLKTLHEKETDLEKAINARAIVFSPIQKFCTRIVNAFSSCGAQELTIEDVKSVNRKIQGVRVDTTKTKAIKANKAAAASEQNDEQVGKQHTAAISAAQLKVVSVSQQSFNQVTENFSKLVIKVKDEPLYAPNEPELKITALVALSADLTAKNEVVNKTLSAYDEAMKDRNNVLYDPSTGLVALSLLVKKYVKSVFFANSPEYKRISKIEFRNGK
jgi:hypothetical protein